jgi:predicted PurR-regulated permease PerM
MTTDRAVPVLLAICTAILVATALYFARSIFAPFAFAIFMVAIVWPLQRTLEGKLPQFVALVLTLLVTLVVILAFSSMVAWALSVAGQWLISHAPRFQAVYFEWTHWLEEHDIFIVGPLSERFDVRWLVGLFQTVAGRINNLVGFALLAFVFMMFALLETGVFRARLAASDKEVDAIDLTRAGEEVAVKFRKYMMVRTQLSALTGIAVWLFAFAAGLELASAWGVIAFALNYIPFLGPFIATILPAVFAMAQFETWQQVLFVLLGLFAIQFAIGNYLEPLVAGKALAISPLVVVFAVFFWSFLWGIPGAFIGVPITIAILTLCKHHPSTRWSRS